MPWPLIAMAISSLVSAGAGAVQQMRGMQAGSASWKANGAAATNSIDAAMDKNRWAFASGLIPAAEFDRNYAWLWNQLQSFATEIASAGSNAARDYAARMISDRQASGQFGNIWQGTYHTEMHAQLDAHLDALGYVQPEWQWPWPEKSRFTEIPISLAAEGMPAEVLTTLRTGLTPGATGGPSIASAPGATLASFFGVSSATGTSYLVIGGALIAGVLLWRKFA